MEREISPFDFTEKESKVLSDKKLYARWVREGEGDARADAHVETTKRRGYARHPELDRRVGTQRIYVCSMENKERRDKEKAALNKERMALMREHSAVIMDRMASTTKGIRPVGYMGNNKDVNFDKRMRFHGEKVDVPRREEE